MFNPVAVVERFFTDHKQQGIFIFIGSAVCALLINCLTAIQLCLKQTDELWHSLLFINMMFGSIFIFGVLAVLFNFKEDALPGWKRWVFHLATWGILSMGIVLMVGGVVYQARQ